jgi:hypothetical protein
MLTSQEKTERRIAIMVGRLMSRRAFVMTMAAAGVTILKPTDIFAQTFGPDEALLVAYEAFLLGADVDVDHDNEKPPKDWINNYPSYDKTNDGHNGNGTNDIGKCNGPHSAREWLIWRVRDNFQKQFDANWTAQARYVLDTTYKMGALAAMKSNKKKVKWLHSADALYETNRAARARRDQQAARRGTDLGPEDLWCE